MRRTVLTVLAAYLAMGLGFAEAQSCSSIVSKICTLANFQPDPNTGYDANRSPICDAANLPTGAQTAAIEAAYEMAPPISADGFVRGHQVPHYSERFF
jgi:hypothetical protein